MELFFAQDRVAFALSASPDFTDSAGIFSAASCAHQQGSQDEPLNPKP